MPDRPPILELRSITKQYSEAGRPHVVLQDVTLSLPEGEFVAVLGRSGSGKSTLLNLIAGIDEPSSGELTVLGRPITALGDRERTLFRRSQLGFVFQFFNLIPTLTVLENVRLPLDLDGGGDDATRTALGLLDQVGLADRRDTFPDRLSGGEQQRVAIARALVADPHLVLADEPTGNLDAESGERVLALLCSLTRDRGRTLVVATHSRAVAAQADRVLRVEGARVVEVGHEVGMESMA